MNRRVAAEALGTALLVYVIVGSGIVAQSLSDDARPSFVRPRDRRGTRSGGADRDAADSLRLPFQPFGGTRLWRIRAIEGTEAARYMAAQIIGGFAGVVAAHMSFEKALASVSTTTRGGLGIVLSEAVATFVLVLVILALVRTGRTAAIPIAVGAWVASAVYATSSTGFANPAVTIARIFTDTYTGIAPTWVPGFLIAQVVAGFAAAGAAIHFYPEAT